MVGRRACDANCFERVVVREILLEPGEAIAALEGLGAQWLVARVTFDGLLDTHTEALRNGGTRISQGNGVVREKHEVYAVYLTACNGYKWHASRAEAVEILKGVAMEKE